MHNDEDIDNDIEGQIPPDVASDLKLLFASEFRIGQTPIKEIKREKVRPFWVRFRTYGRIHNRAFQSAITWRTRVVFSVKRKVPLEVLEMDEWGRLKAMFPTEVRTRLAWNAAHVGELAPVARFFDPDGDAEMLLIRSRCRGHAVDVVHNLTDGRPVLQPLWIADIMRLHPLLGLKLMRDETFQSSALLSILSQEKGPRQLS